MAHGRGDSTASCLESSCVEALVRISDVGDVFLQTWESGQTHISRKPKAVKTSTPITALRKLAVCKQSTRRRRLVLGASPVLLSSSSLLRSGFRRSDQDWTFTRGCTLRRTAVQSDWSPLKKLTNAKSVNRSKVKEDLEARITAALLAKRAGGNERSTGKRRVVKNCRSLASPCSSVERRLATPAAVLLLPFKPML